MKTKTKFKLNFSALLGVWICIVFIFTCFFHFGQQTIYSEPFSNQENKGVSGTNNGFPTVDLTGVTWTIDYSAATLSATTDWFKVTNGVMEARDVDGLVYWISPSIDVSSYIDVSIQLDASEQGNLESSDVFISEFSLDGGAWT